MPTKRRHQHSAHFRDSVAFNNADGATRVGSSSLFAGIPVGIEFKANWFTYDMPILRADDIPVASGTAGSEGDNWTVTVTGTTPVASLADDLYPPRLIVTNSATDNDSWEAQYSESVGQGEFVNYAGGYGKIIYFKTMFCLTDATANLASLTNIDFFHGLCITDTTVIDGATDFVGFSKVDGSNDVVFVYGQNASASGVLRDKYVSTPVYTYVAADAGIDLAQMHSFEFILTPDEATLVYVDGLHKLTVTPTTALPYPGDENLCPTIALQNGEGVAKVMHIAKFMVALEL